MECPQIKQLERQAFVRWVWWFAMLVALLVLVPETFAQHGAGGHFGGFSGGHEGSFSGGGFRGSFSAAPSFRSFTGPAMCDFSAAPRMTWSVPRYNFVPRAGVYSGYRLPSSAMDRGGLDYRGRHRPPYHGGYGYGSYPYTYGYPYSYLNSWELLPWDLGYPDFTGYGDDYDDEANNAQVQPASEEQEPAHQEGEGYWPEYPPAPYQFPYQPPDRQQAASTPPMAQPELTLIFKDGRTMAVRNYMVTSSDVIVMDDAASGRESSIPLSELNLPATERAARQGGLDFSPPST